MASPEEFLEAEQRAAKLVSSLEKLKQEASSYATATENLEQVRTQLVELIKGTEGVAQAAHEALQTIRSVGGPEILDQLSLLQAELLKHVSATRKMQEDTATRLQALQGRVTIAALLALGALVAGVIAMVGV